jgi:hypothetical protein
VLVYTKQFAENREKASVWGKWLLFVCAAVLTGLLTSEAAGKKQKKRAAREEVYKRKKMIPQHKMNMPAVLYFLNHDHTPDLLAAALMDLVRKGNVRQISEEKFILLHQDTDENHERILLELLFNRVGKDGSFSLEDLEQYVQREVNRATYQEEMANWLRAVKEEINRFNLYEAKPAFRWTLGIAGLSVLASSIFFIIYGLYGLMSAAIAAGLASLCLAVFYRPLSYEGLLLKEGWSRLEKGFGKMSTSEWDRISDDDKWRSLIYGVGAKKSRLADHFSQALQDAGQKPANDAMAYFLIAASFGKTEEYIHQSTASDSSAAGSFSGGGAGGGGGGSGAF